MTRPCIRPPSWTMVLLAALVAFAPAQKARAQDSTTSEASAKKAREKAREKDGTPYGNMPEGVIPFRNFRDPYAGFFEKQVQFLGTGRYPAADQNTARIGFFAPVEPASDADIGQHMLEGVQLAIDQANAAGGYNGTPFELVIRADLGLWGASSNEMAAFRYVDHALAVIGSIDGGNTHIALRVALKTQTPMVNTATTDPTLTETAIPWILRCMADDRQQGYALAQHMFRELDIKSVAALRVNDRYGRMGMIEFRDAALRLGRPLRAELRWNRGERDFDVQLDRIAALAPEAIVLWGNARDAAAVVREIRRRGMELKIFGCDRLASQDFLDTAGAAAEGVTAAASYDPTRDDARLREFFTAYRERFGNDPDAFAAHGYDGARILIEAIHKGGLNRARIRDALYEYRHYDGVTGRIEFDVTLNDVGPVYIATVQDGRFVYHELKYATGPAGDTPQPYRTLKESAPKARAPVRRAAAPGAAVRVGCFLPLDERGRAIVSGVESAVADDARRNPEGVPVTLVVRDARDAWRNNGRLVDMVTQEQVIALVGSSERMGTHLAETIAAKMHFPLLSLCGEDPTITAIPMPWVFCVSPRNGNAGMAAGTEMDFALGYDAARLVLDGIREGADSRRELRDTLAKDKWHEGLSGTFKFDALGNRVDMDPATAQEERQP